MVELKQLEISELEPNPRQPRVRFDEAKLKELSDSLRESGLLQPIIVRKRGEKYQIVAGERRWRAARLAGLEKVPVLVRDTADTKLLLESFVENIHRDDLTSTEKENAIYELWKSGNYASHRHLAQALGLNNSTVSNIIEAKQFRDRAVGLPNTIPTTMISETQGLDDSTRIKILERVERGELKQRPSQTEIREVVQVLKKAPLPLRRAFERGEVKLERAAEAVQLYEEIEREGSMVEERKLVQYVEGLKKEEAEEIRRAHLRKRIAKEALTGQKPIDMLREQPSHWADELETESPSTQVGNWWKWNLSRAGRKFDFFTTHYSQKDLPTFIETLTSAGVKTLIDVRQNPVSQFRPEYSKQNLAKELKSRGIGYLHAPELGVPRNKREELAKNGDWDAFFTWYDQNVIPNLKEVMEGSSFKDLDEPFAFMCVEVDPTKCHRHRIALALEKQGLRGFDL